MAHGDVTLTTPAVRQVHILDGAAGVTDGVWHECGAYGMGCGTLVIVGTATVEFRGSNHPTRPLDTDHYTLLLPAVTAHSFVVIPGPLPRWIKARVTAVAGACDSFLILRSRVGG